MSLPVIDSGPSARGWSYYSTFLRCPQLFFWRYVYTRSHHLGWDDNKPALARGTLVHVGLAHHYARQWAVDHGKDPNRILAPLNAVQIKAEQMGDVGSEMQPVAEAMLYAYWRRYPTETFKVIAVEEPVEIFFDGTVHYTARLDLTVVEPDGKIYILDTKTTARFESKTFPKYTLHGQFFGQWYLGRHYWGDKFAGVMVNAVSEEGECARRRQDPAPFMLRKFPDTVVRAARAIERAQIEWGEDQEKWDAHPDEQICFGPYGRCPAFELCRWGRADNGTA